MPGESKGLPKFLAHKYLDHGFCNDFFMALEDNECVRVVHDTSKGHWWTGKSWCWVSMGCPLASEVSPSVEVNAKVKFCGPNDLMLSHFSMEGLIEYSEAQGMDLALTLKSAFGVSHQLEWGHFQSTYMAAHCSDYGTKKHLKGKAMTALQADLEAILKDHQTGADPMHALCLVNDGIPPFGCITPDSIWEIYGTGATSPPSAESTPVCLCGNCPP